MTAGKKVPGPPKTKAGGMVWFDCPVVVSSRDNDGQRGCDDDASVASLTDGGSTPVTVAGEDDEADDGSFLSSTLQYSPALSAGHMLVTLTPHHHDLP